MESLKEDLVQQFLNTIFNMRRWKMGRWRDNLAIEKGQIISVDCHVDTGSMVFKNTSKDTAANSTVRKEIILYKSKDREFVALAVKHLGRIFTKQENLRTNLVKF